jgi:hypothetical protein
MSTQIEIGLEITDLARQEIEEGKKPVDAFVGLANQCLGRDEDWKAFYVEKMEDVKPSGADPKVLQIYAAELAAEQAYVAGDYAIAAQTLQNLLDDGVVEREDAGWYLQEQARFYWEKNRVESQAKQIAAHKKKSPIAQAANWRDSGKAYHS